MTSQSDIIYNLSHDPRIYAVRRMSNNVLKVTTKPGYFIPPNKGMHGNMKMAHENGFVGSFDEAEKATETIRLCYCPYCREAVVKAVLDNGELPAYLEGWKP